MAYELVMYSRSYGCPFVSTALRVFSAHRIPFREILIDKDDAARERVLQWTGFLSVPTLIVANPGEDMPIYEPDPLPAGESPRGIDRGPMITEPSEAELTAWLTRHAFITQADSSAP